MPNVMVEIQDIRLGDRIGISGQCKDARFNPDGSFAVKFESDGWHTFELPNYMVEVSRSHSNMAKAIQP